MTRLLAILVCIGTLLGCTTRRSGYAVDEWVPTPGMTYYDVLGHLGNPMRVKVLDSGTEAVWIGSMTNGGSFILGYSGIRFTLGNERAATAGLRLHFDNKGQLTSASPIGSTELPPWSICPFGE